MSFEWTSNSQDIYSLIQEHPDLPIYFMVSEEISGEYFYTLHHLHKASVETITLYEDRVYQLPKDEGYLKDDIFCNLDDAEILEAGLGKQDVLAEVERFYNNLKKEDAIIVWTSL